MPAISVHRTPVSDASWDGPANERRLRLDQPASYYRRAYAWQDPDGNERTKAAYRFIHHFVAEGGNIGAASLVACRTGIAVLNGARGGTTIPDADRRGVWEHLAQHIRDAGEEPPELRAPEASEIREGGSPEVKALDADVQLREESEIVMTITTETRDREGDIIRASGWRLDRYMRNPVVLWAHQHATPPVAKAKQIEPQGDRLVAIAEFVPEDTPVVGPLATALKRLYRDGFMRGVSVGFLPLKWRQMPDGGREFIEQELLEFSFVPVPANPEALARGVSGIDALQVSRGIMSASNEVLRNLLEELKCRK